MLCNLILLAALANEPARACPTRASAGIGGHPWEPIRSSRSLASIVETPGLEVLLLGPQAAHVEHLLVRNHTASPATEEVFVNPLAVPVAPLASDLVRALFPSPRLLETLRRATRLRASLSKFAFVNGGYPSPRDYALIEAVGPQGESYAALGPPPDLEDGYGNPFRYTPTGWTQLLRTFHGNTTVFGSYELLSTGPDGQAGTSDDMLLTAPSPTSEASE